MFKFLLIFFTLVFPFRFALASNAFPICEELRPRVEFWKRVYTEIDSQQSFLHDSEHPEVIYKKINYQGLKGRAKRNLVKKEIRKLKRTMWSMIQKKLTNLSVEEEQLYEVMQKPSLSLLKSMRHNIRSQQGMLDRYYSGLLRSFSYIEPIKKIFDEMNLPLELAYLPHVESSFNYRAYSKVGAAGMWQFMRSTARLYKMKMNYLVDERRDPLISARAAAKLLRDNYRVIKAWPLAVTAYNHGLASMKRAVRLTGSTDMCTIIERYNGRRFGFASKSFYATFLAAVEVSKDPGKYFSNIPKIDTIQYDEIQLPKPLTVKQIAEAVNVSESMLRDYNPAIRPSAFKSNLFLHKGTRLNLPRSSRENLDKQIAALEEIKVPKRSLAARRTHVVSRGESLFTISRLYGVNLRDVIVLNEISNPARIYKGMQIKIPGKEDAAKIASNEKPEVPAEIPTPKPIEKSELKAKTTWIKKIFSKDERKVHVESPKIADVKRDTSSLQAPPPEIKKSAKSRPDDIDHYNFEINKLKPQMYEITIEPEETLGHYSDWSGVGVSQIRRINNIGRRRPIKIGDKLKIPMKDKKIVEFNSERMQFHAAIEEDFYENFQISGTTKYIVKRGDTIDKITKDFEVPFWVIRKYQKNGLNESLFKGQSLIIPKIVAN